MEKTIDTPKCGGKVATTQLMENGGLPAEPQAEAPAASRQRRRVLSVPVEILPSKHDLKAEKPFPFRSVEQYAELEAKPVRHILSRIFSSGWVKLTAIAGAIAAPFVQIGINKDIDLSIYSYFSQQADNFSKVFSGIYEHSSAILIGFAAAIAAVGLSVPFVSSEGREESIREREQEHESEEVRKAHKSARRWEEAHRMVRKFRGASLLATIPLVASDFWAYANGGFRGASQFFQGMSTSAQVMAGAFLALVVVSIITLRQCSKAVLNASDKSYAYNVAKQAEEEKANAPALARETAESEARVSALEQDAAAENARVSATAKNAGIPANVVDISRRREAPEAKESCGVQPASEEEANALQQLYSMLEQQRYEIENLRAESRVMMEKLGLALAAKEAIERKLLSQEKAEDSIRENDGLKKSLAARRAEISLLIANIEGANATLKGLEAERDKLAEEAKRALREREDYAKSNEEKDRKLQLAANLLKKRSRELADLKAQLAAAKLAKPEAAPEAAEPAPEKEAIAPEAEAVSLDAAPLVAAPEPVNTGPAAPAEVPAPAEVSAAAAPEPPRGSPGQGLPQTVVDSPGDEEDGMEGYRTGGPAISI